GSNQRGEDGSPVGGPVRGPSEPDPGVEEGLGCHGRLFPVQVAQVRIIARMVERRPRLASMPGRPIPVVR
ncbi:MAG: hypothetical protein QGI09_08960, partial [Dehalococcoidia bacterium]|nr:hypothetical protein [Dehalococcoidia bacterium]